MGVIIEKSDVLLRFTANLRRRRLQKRLTEENDEYGDESAVVSLATAHSLSRRRGSKVAATVSTRSECAVSSIEAAAATEYGEERKRQGADGRAR